MGLMTLTDYQNDLKDALGRPTVDSTRLTRWINNALIEVAYAFEFPEMQKLGTITTSPGSVAYDMPADFRALQDTGVRINFPSNRVAGILAAESRTEYLRNYRYDQISNRGVVGYYHMFQKKMWLRPIPDSTSTTVEFDYWKRVTPLVNPLDVSPLEDDWDEIVFRGALYRGHLAYGEHDRLLNVFNLFLSDIRSRVMAEDLQEFPEGGISAIQHSFDNLRR